MCILLQVLPAPEMVLFPDLPAGPPDEVADQDHGFSGEGGIVMPNDIAFQINESYRKTGFDTHDNFCVSVTNLTEGESQWLRGQVLILVAERGRPCPKI